jgi:hypothetical protein
MEPGGLQPVPKVHQDDDDERTGDRRQDRGIQDPSIQRPERNANVSFGPHAQPAPEDPAAAEAGRDHDHRGPHHQQ